MKGNLFMVDNNKLLTNDLLNFIKGDISKVSIFANTNHYELIKLFNKLPTIILTRKNIITVLENFRNENVSEEDVQKWASFIRRGYFSSNDKTPTKPIDIDYENEHEEIIIEAIARLDEIGDLIDGHISEKEIDEFIQLLDE